MRGAQDLGPGSGEGAGLNSTDLDSWHWDGDLPSFRPIPNATCLLGSCAKREEEEGEGGFHDQ